MNIVKKQNGSVVINAIDKAYQSMQFSAGARICLTKDNVFEVFEGFQKVFSFRFNEVETTQIEPAAAVGTTTQAALLTLLQEDFFFDVTTTVVFDQIIQGEVNNIPSGSGVQTLAEFTTENNSIYFGHLHISARNSLGESWSNYITNALRVRTSNTGVVSLDNTGAGAVFETFTVNPTFTLTSPSNNTVRYTINFLTNALASAKVTIWLVKHKY